MSGIMPLINVPDAVQYGRIQAHLMAFIADTLDDDDQIPDAIPLEGVVVLTPTVGVVRFPTTAPPCTAVVQALRCPIIGGDLYPPDTPLEGPLPDMPGVVVVASSQPVGLPDTVQWTAKFELVGATVQPPSVTFEVPSGGVVDLTTVIPATPTPGTVVVVSTESRDRAETAAATATQKASAAASSATAAASSAASISWAGLPGKPAVIAAGATAAAARAAIGAADVDHAALKDTGWRNIASLLDPAKWGLSAATPYLQVRREGTRVTIRGRLTATAANPASTIILTMPAGFRPASSYNVLGMGLLSDVMVAITNLTDPNSLSLRVPAAKDAWLAFEINFATNNPFPAPAEYPGTPA